MSIGPDSRYQDAVQIFAQTHTYSEARQTDLTDTGEAVQEVRDTLYMLTVANEADDDLEYYIVKDGDDITVLAAQFLGDPALWWRIADANPELRYPLDLRMGTKLRIPE